MNSHYAAALIHDSILQGISINADNVVRMLLNYTEQITSDTKQRMLTQLREPDNMMSGCHLYLSLFLLASISALIAVITPVTITTSTANGIHAPQPFQNRDM